jgi:hypothetical protein
MKTLHEQEVACAGESAKYEIYLMNAKKAYRDKEIQQKNLEEYFVKTSANNKIELKHCEIKIQNETKHLETANFALEKVYDKIKIVCLSTDVQTLTSDLSNTKTQVQNLTSNLLMKKAEYDQLLKQFTEFKYRKEITDTSGIKDLYEITNTSEIEKHLKSKRHLKRF